MATKKISMNKLAKLIKNANPNKIKKGIGGKVINKTILDVRETKEKKEPEGEWMRYSKHTDYSKHSDYTKYTKHGKSL